MRTSLLAAFVCWFLSVSGRAAELPDGFTEEVLATHLNAVTAMASTPDGRLFIADQTGNLLVWKDGHVLDTPALTLHVTDYWERGLIGVTLHPDFPHTPEIFVLYVTDHPFVHHVISRFTMNGDQADPASEKILFEGDDQAKLGGHQPAGHQGGPLRFGPDGTLYIGLGEQTARDPSQRLDTLQGKILRLNADGTIPEDNPFYGTATGKYRAIWAYGIRNPFGMAFQPETGR
jgi:glucose/arabinose dehydrogenase